MHLSRRRFFQSSFAATAAALAAPRELLAFTEPQRTPQPGGAILLNGNENAYGAWPSLIESMKDALSLAHRYPDNAYDPLTQRIAALHRVLPEQVILGCGSGEILRICAEAFTTPELGLVTAAPTFEALGHHVRSRGHRVTQVRLNADHQHDVAKMTEAASGQTGLIYICNPNNPTASITPRSAIESLISGLKGKELVLIDEAYHHFALSSPEYVSFLDKPFASDRVIVARTFSKIYGLAGVRIGYAVASRDIAARMQRFALPDSLNVVGARTATAALADTDGLAFAIKRNAADRDEFLRQAKQRNIQTIPSQGNFVMVDTGRPVRQAIAHFRQNNILIGRPFPPYETHARISLGKPDEMVAFWKVWDKLGTA
ncbi:MAG TPA: aminotransferase class I/II-fold pyridoxal phosphate-dependent enzyme [Terriglobales bacterium]|nr:aminotransferase class I/II-fold pyridoxal phosphate-dependent enzyme [Terriglobales bacterium]